MHGGPCLNALGAPLGTWRERVLCTSCEQYVYTDAAHSCYSAKQVRAVRDAERAVIEKAKAYHAAATTGDDWGYDGDAAHDALLDAVRALHAATGAG